MTMLIVMIAVGLSSALVSWALWLMFDHRQSWRDRQPSWWGRPVDGIGLRQSVRPIDERAQAEILEMRDPRRVGGRR